jgi:hypothetical protein
VIGTAIPPEGIQRPSQRGDAPGLSLHLQTMLQRGRRAALAVSRQCSEGGLLLLLLWMPTLQSQAAQMLVSGFSTVLTAPYFPFKCH